MGIFETLFPKMLKIVGSNPGLIIMELIICRMRDIEGNMKILVNILYVLGLEKYIFMANSLSHFDLCYTVYCLQFVIEKI